MMTHIQTPQVSISNYDDALAFYTGTLGWEKREDVPMGGEGRWLTVGIPGATTGASLAGPGMHDERTPGGYTGIQVVTDDIEADFGRLSAAGVTFTQPVATEPLGDKATWFVDPDGNQFYLIESAQPT